MWKEIQGFSSWQKKEEEEDDNTNIELFLDLLHKQKKKNKTEMLKSIRLNHN